MTDLELAAALRDAIAASPSAYPHTQTLLRKLVPGAPAPRAMPRPVVIASRSSVYEPVPGLASIRPIEGSVPAAIEQRLLVALATAQRPGETIEVAFRRKEADIARVFEDLAPVEARALLRRLVACAAADAVAQAFARLTSERRARLISYLQDTRRRLALKGAA